MQEPPIIMRNPLLPISQRQLLTPQFSSTLDNVKLLASLKIPPKMEIMGKSPLIETKESSEDQ